MIEYINLVLFNLSAAIFYAFIGGIIGIVIVLSLKRMNYLERKNIFLQVITSSYYLLFPLAFFFFFWFAGSLWCTKKAVDEVVDDTIEELRTAIYPSLVTFLEERMQAGIDGGNIPSNKVLVEDFLGEQENYTEPSVFRYVLKLGLTLTLEQTIGTADTRTKYIGTVYKGASLALFEGLLGDIKDRLHTITKQYATVFLIPIVLLFLFVLLFPTIEIILSTRLIIKNNP